MLSISSPQSIPQFLPVMRGSHNAQHANRDPEVLERLQPVHLYNMCFRLQAHMHLCAERVTTEQTSINARLHRVEADASKVLAVMTERQKKYAMYADQFAKVRNISQKLSRCSVMVKQNLEAMEDLNARLKKYRLEPFEWRADWYRNAGVKGRIANDAEHVDRNDVEDEEKAMDDDSNVVSDEENATAISCN